MPDPAPGEPLPAVREPERGTATAPVPAAEANPDPRPGARGETRPEARLEARPEERSEAPSSGRAAPVDPAPADARSPSLLAEPVQRINEAVRMGRIESAAAMAEQTIASAVQRLGAEHPEVLQLRELAAYIAYLAGDAHRSFVLSMALARVRRGSDDQGAFGNVMSAAAAWRALRDPALGLALGHELIALWDAMAAAGGAAAADPSQLEAARARMGRLAERARGVGEGPRETEGPRAQDR
ncbi:hypothetical protein GTW46_20730 [Streptomyces sp. SID6013]|nr:hypothetical protein [Streptomyces sp. SID6013]